MVVQASLKLSRLLSQPYEYRDLLFLDGVFNGSSTLSLSFHFNLRNLCEIIERNVYVHVFVYLGVFGRAESDHMCRHVLIDAALE